MDYIISIDLQLNKLDLHIIKMQGFSGAYTWKVLSIHNMRELSELHLYIKESNFSAMTKWFKEKLGIAHCRITYCYGPGLRRYLKTIKERKKENGKN